MPYGDRAYEHAKSRAPGEAENWTRETPPEVNDLRKQEYEKRLKIFKKKEGLQGIGDLKTGRHEFKKGDTLYPILTKEFGMNRHTAFFAMVKLLENNVNVDLWRVGDEIELKDDGSLSLKRAGKELEIKNILEPKTARVPEPAPSKPAPKVDEPSAKPEAGAEPTTPPPAAPVAPPERKPPPPPPPDAAPETPVQPPPVAPPERGTEPAAPPPAAPPPGEPPKVGAPPERAAPPERGAEPPASAAPAPSAPPERKAPPERGAEQAAPSAPAAPPPGAPPERKAPPERDAKPAAPAPAAPAAAPAPASVAPPERGSSGDIRDRSADAFKEAESGKTKPEVRAMSPEEKATYEKLKKSPLWPRILSDGSNRFYRFGFQQFPIHIKSDYIEIRVTGKNARGFPRTTRLPVHFENPQEQDPANIDKHIKEVLDRMLSE